MRHPIALIVGCSLGVALGFMQCGASTCSPTNCLGCCDASGRCAPGTTAASCGAAGRQCLPCPTDAQCREGVCTIVIGGAGGGAAGGTSSSGGGSAGSAATGGGSSSTGGGAASTGGGTSAAGGGMGCLQLPELTANPAGAAYLLRNNGAEMVWTMGARLTLAQPVAGSTTLNVQADLWHPVGSPPTFPVTGAVSPVSMNRTCTECFRLETGCQAGGTNCTGSYLARGGTYSFTSGDTNQQAGRFIGEANQLRFVGWSFQADQPLTQLPCIEVPRLTWNADWP